MIIKYFNIAGIFFLFLLIILTGCREEIISPDNPASNLNEPVQSRTRNSYTFTINADNISFKLIDYPNLTTNNTRVYFYLADYVSGAVEVSLFNESNSIVYTENITGNIPGSYFELKGQLPETIIITCSDFTGKLKIKLTSI